MADGPWLYYKLTNEPKGSGELKINIHTAEKEEKNTFPTSPKGDVNLKFKNNFTIK